MLKKFESMKKLNESVFEDVSYIYDVCFNLGLVQESTSFKNSLKWFLLEGYKTGHHVSLFKIKDKYDLGVTCIGVNPDRTRFKRNNIINYGNFFILDIYDMEAKDYLSQRPFIEMSLKELVSYLRFDTIKKSNNFRYRYDIFRDNRNICSVYGKNNSCIYDYFRSFGGKSVIASRIDTLGSIYRVNKDGKPYEFVVKRSLLSK